MSAISKLIDAVVVDGKSFLVTGASGLIGSCLVDILMCANMHGKKNHVYVLGRSEAKLMDVFCQYAGNEYFHILEQNICSPINEGLKFDYIIHGASNADPISYAKYPVETITTNVIGANNVLEYGKKHQNCKITFLSTFEVYGQTTHDEYKELDFGLVDFNVFRSCYPESKRVMEILSRCYVDEYGVNVNVARLSSVYGPTMSPNDSKAHAQFLRNALGNEDIVMKSKGLAKRTYTYVFDASTAILMILFRGKTGECYNVSNENSIASISDVAHTIASIAGTKVVFDLPSEIEQKGFSNPQNCILNNDKLKSLGWRGRYSLYDGLKNCYDILKA